MRRLALIISVISLLPSTGSAGIYSPDEPFIFEIGADGFARPIQFANGFESILKTLRNVATDDSARTGGPPNTDRGGVETRVQRRLAQGTDRLSADDLAGLTADLIRLARFGDALNILQPLARDRRRGGFVAYTHLARAHQGRGGWREALDQQDAALNASDFPTKFARLTGPQLAWLKRVEREFYLPWLAARADEDPRGGRPDTSEAPDPLFPASRPQKNAHPVRFLGEGGEYTPGAIAAAEKVKLPADAIAIVQQLLLWNPQDTRLYWQLGELYNAQGEVETALKIFDDCANAGYATPPVQQHRRSLMDAADAAARVRAQSRADEDAVRLQAAVAEREYQKRFWWIVAGGVALAVLLVYYQSREMVRRFRNS